jgi:hypothetical protein
VGTFAKQDFGSENLKFVASSVFIDKLDNVVKMLGISVGDWIRQEIEV